MVLVAPLKEADDEQLFGGKASALARLAKIGVAVPAAVCLSTEAYNLFVDATGIRDRISMELGRKSLEEMRWEELWDASLRIRALFLRASMPDELQSSLELALISVAEAAVVVRSSAVGEDSSHTSFAGIHESYVNIHGRNSIIEHIKLVWASLWSDAALLYRRELDLNIEKSAMAVVVQEIVTGERSGVAFSTSPSNPEQSVIEAVHGLNQGLVDGMVEPDRWILERSNGKILSHHVPKREKAVVPDSSGTVLRNLTDHETSASPLTDEEALEIYRLAVRAEEASGKPQDVEWTIRRGRIYCLQSRPVTTLPRDERRWYLGLHRSIDNLQSLRIKIECEIIPAMAAQADELSGLNLAALQDEELAEEIERRAGILQRWRDIYREHLIPFAHGARLFGQIYNDALHPAEPHQFLELLGGNMVSQERNRELLAMASRIREDPSLSEGLKDGADVLGLREFMSRYGMLAESWNGLVRILMEMATFPPVVQERMSRRDLEDNFLSHFQGDERKQAEKLLDLGRASYRLRDDDNIFLGRIESQQDAALIEAGRRLKARGLMVGDLAAEEAIRALKDPKCIPQESKGQKERRPSRVLARQIIGQPASRGLATGRARVVLSPQDLFKFQSGEVLVCDALDPTMTFVVPLASAIVERRGGMLVHGSIIAREYRIPCVTGVQAATEQIETGDRVTVDGFLGIVTIDRRLQAGQML
jgi:phosphohistidine swiveling domain-containing protein